jgi:hypothetical protein
MYSFITDTWNNYLLEIPFSKRDIYFTEEYVKLYEGPCQTALCYVYFDNRFILLMPYIRSRIGDSFYDFETPYGYGGPITNCTDNIWISMALSEMKILFMQEHYIAGLIRFHPLLDNVNSCKDIIPMVFERSTVFVDLSMSLDDIWALQISSKNRNTIRKAEKVGLTFIVDFCFENLEPFIQLYTSTMDKICADQFYYFSKEYFTGLKMQLQNNSCLGMIKKDEHIVAAAIFMFYSDYGHYHLAGSDQMFSNHGANNFLLWNIMKTLQERGVKKFHLGGGTSYQPDDTLFKFKKSFSNNRASYYIGKLVFDDEKYNMVCMEWEQNNPNKIELYKNRLLKYRY